ncbi:MAG: hypothetical protein JKY52_01740 [Flavobacteriales bacterium]|nr:hypothetical protein [Flavobacteriales bacterium]
MILQLFKNQRPTTLGLLVLISFALWSFSFAHTDVLSSADGSSLFDWLLHLIEGIPLIKALAAVALLIVQAIMINNIIIENQLISTRTYIPSLIYIVLMSSTPELLTFYPGLIGNFFFILMLNRLFRTYRDESSNAKIFDAGLYLGLASTVHFSFILMLAFGWLTLAILRSFSWRDSIVLMLGTLVPYCFIFTYFYAFDDILNLKEHFSFFADTRVYQEVNLTYNYTPLMFMFTGLLIIAAKTVFLEWRIGAIKVKKLLSTLTIFSAFSLLLPLILSGLDISFYAALAIPLSIYLSNYFINTNKKVAAEVAFLLLLSSIVYLHIVTL